MTSKLNETLIPALKAYLHTNLGLNYSANSEKELVRKIEYAAQEFGYSNVSLFVEWVLTENLTAAQTGLLASHLTIGETYFFREMKGFEFLEQIYLPALIHKRYGSEKRLRIWCAGCATGEEAYSLAILLMQAIPDLHLWNVSILATDINPKFLEKARTGIYSKWSFRNSSEQFIGKYFTRVGPNEFHILPRIKNMVTFSTLNLAEDGYPSMSNGTNAMDIIFCRNVLIYFSPEGIGAVTRRLHRSLITGGVMVLSPVEVSGMIFPEFNKIFYAGLTIFQKTINKPAETKENNSEIMLPDLFPVPTTATLKTETRPPASDLTDFNRLKSLLPANPGEEIVEKSDNEFKKARELFAQGLTKANLGKLKEAEELCMQAIKKEKFNPGLYYLLATVFHEQGEDAKAVKLLNQAIYLDQDFVLAWFLLGTLSMKSGDHAAGKKSFDNALTSLSKLQPNDLLPESDGITVARFSEILNAIRC